MIFWRENSNKTFLVISNNVEQDILFSMHNFQKKGKVPSTDFPLLWKFEVFFYIRRGETLCTKTLVQKRRRLLWGWRPYYPHMSEWSAYSNFFHKSGKMYEAAAQKFCCVFQPSAVFPSFSITRSWSDIQSIALCIERAEFPRNWKFSTDFWVENPFICFSGFLIIILFDPLFLSLSLNILFFTSSRFSIMARASSYSLRKSLISTSLHISKTSFASFLHCWSVIIINRIVMCVWPRKN